MVQIKPNIWPSGWHLVSWGSIHQVYSEDVLRRGMKQSNFTVILMIWGKANNCFLFFFFFFVGEGRGGRLKIEEKESILIITNVS